MSRPGYKEFLLKPQVGGTLTEAKARYESLYGTIISEWKREGEQVKYTFTIPANTKARIQLPGQEELVAGSGTYSFTI